MFRMMIQKKGFPNDRRTCPGSTIIAGLAAILICLLFVDNGVVWGQAESPVAGKTPMKGFRASGAPETYAPDTLWEKINGQAEMYLSAGFVSLQSQWYEAVDDEYTVIEVNQYHMGGLMNAFSIFSLQRRESAQTIDVTPFAYQTDSSIHMVHGPYYVEILASPPSGSLLPKMRQLAEQFIRDTPVKEENLHLLAAFPPENQVKGSAAMIAGDAFGYDRLDNVFTVAYETDSNRSIAYVSKRKTARDARAMVNGLHNFFVQYGGRSIETHIDVEGTKMVEIMGAFEIMFSYGEYFAGVHEAPDRKQAEKVAEMLANSLKEKSGKTDLVN